MPLAAALTVRVAVPDPVNVVGASVAVRPGDALNARITVPAKPFSALTEMVEVAVLPGAIGSMFAGLAVTLKSRKLKVAVAVLVIAGLELVPVMVTT